MSWTRKFDAIRERVASFLSRANAAGASWHRPLLAVVLVAVLTFYFAASLSPGRVDVEVDHPSPQSFKAPFDMIDRPTTERLRREAAERIPDLYEPDLQVDENVMDRLAEDFAGLREIAAMADLTVELQAALLEEKLEIAFTEDVVQGVLQLTPRTMDLLESTARTIMTELLAQGIRAEELESIRHKVPEAVRIYEFDRPATVFLSLLLQNRLQANLVFNEEATLAAREQARAGVEARIIRRDEVIVYEGQRITEDDLVRLRDAGLLRPDAAYPSFAGALLMSAALVGLMAAYLRFFDPTVFGQPVRLLLLALIMVSTLVVARFTWLISGYAMPTAAGSMLLALLLNPQVAIFATILMAVTLGIVTGGQLVLALVVLVGGLVGVYSVTRVGQRSDLMRAGLYVGLVNGLMIIAWLLLHGAGNVLEMALWRDVLWGVAAGVVSAVLTIGSLPFLETFSGILTPVRLLELANPDQPLLRRLLVEAPGTYHHSIMVANLAEAAVERVGGNSLLARVGAYYHDIGKLKRPYFFAENQFGGENPHDKISANLSALIITAHVKDGVELAQEHRLPAELVRFIQEHHGTMRVQYFYNKALEETGGEGLLEENFVYPGPVPQSRETAICMLADSAEAAVRSMTKPTPARIESTVRKLIKDRLNDGQLDRCDLTLKDLNLIADTFTQILNGIFHARIEYPDPPPTPRGKESGKGTGSDNGRQ